jgi:hypothetical protein
VRTGDVDVVVEGEQALEAFRGLLREISTKGSRVYLPKVREISEKAIDVVGTVYDRRKPPVKFSVNGYRVYVLPPEEVVLTYLEAWKFWNSLEDRNKAVVVYCAQKEALDVNYIAEEAKRRNVEDYLRKLDAFCPWNAEGLRSDPPTVAGPGEQAEGRSGLADQEGLAPAKERGEPEELRD